MKLQELFDFHPSVAGGTMPDIEVSDVCDDARRVTKDAVFVAIRGRRADGHDFLAQAVSAGARALVVEDLSKVPAGFAGVVMHVPDSRSALDHLAARWAGDPATALFCAGVTGTNGKTSTAYMIECILNEGGFRTGVIGTVDHHLGPRVWPTTMTTPGPIDLQRRLREFADAGATALAMEVSSHALHQRRADSVPFDAAVFTNLTRDHLDYHKNMQEYFDSKQRLFTDLLWRTVKRPCYAIVNIADNGGRRLRIAEPARLWTYGTTDADFSAKIERREFTRTVFSVRTPAGEGAVNLPMGGDHNVQNALAAIAVGLAAGLSLDRITSALGSFAGVPGRLQSVPNGAGLSVLVDYAHTPDALEKVLNVLGEIRSASRAGGRIWTVFGCGGDRDPGKRPEMMKVAFRGSDQVVVTSDNPRTEDPQAIIADILTGVSGDQVRRVKVEADRKKAIGEAIASAKAGDIILIAGKGHENYQILGERKFPFDDSQVAAEILRTR